MPDATTKPCRIGTTLKIDSDPGATIVVLYPPTGSEISNDFKINNLGVFKRIDFQVTLSNGKIGLGSLAGNSSDVKTNNSSVVLDNATVEVTCIQPSPPPLPEIVTVKVDSPNQNDVKAS